MENIKQREQKYNRLYMLSQSDRLSKPVATLVGKSEGMAVQCIPHRLIHIAQIEGRGLEGGIAQDHLLTHPATVRDDQHDKQKPGDALRREKREA